MSRKTRKKLMTAAVNAGAYGEDAISAGTPIPMQTRNLGITPIEGDSIDRELDNGQLGLTPQIMVGTHVKSSGELELAGSGTDTLAPAYAPILNAAGYNDTSESDHVLFSRASEGNEKDATFYVYMDGAYHIITGARATFTTRLAVNELPTIGYEITGLYGGIAGGALPSADFSAFITPVKVGHTHTTLQLGGTEYKMLEFELAENNEIVYDENTVDEQVYLTDYAPEGRILLEAPAIGTFNPFDLALSETLLTLTVIHGTSAGNIVTLNASQIQLGRGNYDDRNGRMVYDIPFRVIGEHTLRTE